MERNRGISKEQKIYKARMALSLYPRDVRPYADVYGHDISVYELYPLIEDAIALIQDSRNDPYSIPSLQDILKKIAELGEQKSGHFEDYMI